MSKGRATAIAAPGVMPEERSIELLWQAFGTDGGAVLPTQIGRADWKPEQEMIGNLIIGAIQDCLTQEEPGQPREKAYRRFMDQRRALGWVFSSGEHVYGFEWCCEHVNVDPSWVRRMVRQRVRRASDIEEHLLDPENVPAPPVPKELLPKPVGRRSTLLYPQLDLLAFAVGT